MKKYKNFNVECIKLIIDDNEDFNESDYELVVESIEKRNWNLFRKIRKEYEAKGMKIDDVLHCRFEEYGDFIYLKLNKELFEVISLVEIFPDGEDYYLN